VSRVEGTGFRVHVSRFLVLNFGLRISGLGFRASGERFRVEGLRFTVSSLGLRVWDLVGRAFRKVALRHVVIRGHLQIQPSCVHLR
jgi:hypothetical protein